MREYEFRYRPKGEKDSSLKYFMANDFKEAKEMFDAIIVALETISNKIEQIEKRLELLEKEKNE